MAQGWAIQLDGASAASVAPLRSQTELQVLVDADSLWVRGPDDLENEAWRDAVAALPCRARYLVDNAGRLRRPGQRVPVGRLPESGWQPIGQWITVTAPAASMPAGDPAPVTLRLEPNDQWREPEAMLTSLQTLAKFALTAPQVRLNCLTFAASDSGEVLIVGQPLPPIRGQRYNIDQGIVTPVGQRVWPPVSAAALREFFDAGESDLLLCDRNEWQLVEARQFVRATRSAVRQTVEHLSVRYG